MIISQNIALHSNADKAEAVGQFFSSSENIIKDDVLEARFPQVVSQTRVITNTVLPSNPSLNLDFTIWELKQVIRSAKNSAPGPDRLSFLMFKHLEDRVLRVFLSFFNRIWALGKLPGDWKHAIVIPILKEGKDGTVPSSYRRSPLSQLFAN